MKKKNMLNAGKILLVFFSMLFTLQAMAEWSAPTQSPPSSISTLVPLNTSSNAQFKNGTIIFQALKTFQTTLLATDSGSVGIGTNVPDVNAKLDLIGRVKITDGTEGAGKVLTSDANGLASWSSSLAQSPWSTDIDGNNKNLFSVGKIGIGTSNPTEPLHVVGNVRFSGALMPNNLEGTPGQALTSNGADIAPTWTTIPALPFGTLGQTLWYNGTSWVATSNLKNNGTNVSIGVLSPSQMFEVGGDAIINSNTVGRGGGNVVSNAAFGITALSGNTSGSYNTAIGGTALSTNVAGSQNTALGYGANVCSGNLNNAMALGYGAVVCQNNRIVLGNALVTSIGGYGPWTNYSDRRLKENITYTDNLGLDFILKLKPVSYNYIADTNKTRRDGLIAQDVKQVLEELNVPFSGLVIGDDKMSTMSLSYESFVLPLIQSIKEQQKELEEIKKENEELKKRFEVLEEKLK